MNFVKRNTPLTTLTLVHISDFHLCQPSGISPGRFLNKRLFSYLSWRIRRQREHRPQVLEALTRAVQAMEADHVVVTGDLTQLALPSEFDQARSILQALGPPQKVFVVPGNHDALVAVSWPESWARWADYMASDSANPQPQVEFPTLRIRGPVALIGLCTARPTPLLSAAGSIGTRQLQRLAEILQETARQSLFRVLLIHHPPIPGMVSFHKRLMDAEAFAVIAKQHGAELILHGHSHLCSRAEMEGPLGRIPVLGISSASAASPRPQRRAAFRSVRIARTTEGWTTTFQDCVFLEETQPFTTTAPASPKSSPGG
ncbi:MAG: metallophosphoesterase [Deltaproteobacteria bacterium]|jgi:3',5'-cyclic AMP phosphodiesterase CpdA|nr:metallophosphoesterase [Deltaproteobacteria bacterium]